MPPSPYKPARAHTIHKRNFWEECVYVTGDDNDDDDDDMTMTMMVLMTMMMIFCLVSIILVTVSAATQRFKQARKAGGNHSRSSTFLSGHCGTKVSCCLNLDHRTAVRCSTDNMQTKKRYLKANTLIRVPLKVKTEILYTTIGRRNHRPWVACAPYQCRLSPCAHGVASLGGCPW